MIGQQTAVVARLRPNPRPEPAGPRRAALANVHPFRRIKSGAVLFHEGDQRNWCYEIVSGMLKLSKLTSDGRMLVIDFLVPGDLANLSDDGFCHSTAEAVGETWVRALPSPQLTPISRWSDDLIRTLLNHALRRESANQHRLLLLRRRHPHQRVAAFLLDMARRQGAMDVPTGAHLALPMVRRDMADYLALAPETLSRVMRRLREDGLIKVHDCRDIELCDVDGLSALSNED